MKFIKGVCKVKEGRKVIAKVIDRQAKADAFKEDTGRPWPYGISKKYPYNVEMLGGVFQCISLEECEEVINKYK